MNKISLDDITPEKSELRLLVESFSDSEFYIQNFNEINSELGLLEIHGLDSRLIELKNSLTTKNSNNGNSYVSYLIGVTSVPPSGPLVKKGGSLPD